MALIDDLQTLGLTEKEAIVYTTLAKLGWATVLTISRHCQIKRSTIHRLIENLRKQGLVKMQLGDKTSYYHITEPENFQVSLKEKESSLKQAKNALSNLKLGLGAIASQLHPTEVEFYRGKRGIQALEIKMSLLKNQTIYIFGAMKWKKVVGNEFAEEIRAKHLKNQLKIWELSNQPLDKKAKNGQIQVNWTENLDYVKHCWQNRVISPKVLTIENDLHILPRSVVLYVIMGDEITGVEIVNSSYAHFMRQLFLLAWGQAK